MRLRVLAAAAVFSGMLVACQTPPEPAPALTEPEPAGAEEIDLPDPPDPDTPMLNEWGGEIPLTQPTEAVSEGSLEDLR